MEQNAHGGCNDAAAVHVKTEAADENASVLDLCSQDPPAPCGGEHQTAEEQQGDTQLHAASTAPVLLYSVSSDRFFTTSGDGKAFLKIAPASVIPNTPPEKTIPTGSDFSSKAVLCLIEAVGRRWGLYETRERSQLFQSVQEEMASKGHILPVEKIRRKWNNLIVTYKRVKDRSRETGHAKTSWEFFDLMDATLCDTVGNQIVYNKRNKGGNTVPTLPAPMSKVTSKPPVPQPASVGRLHSDFTNGVESATQPSTSSQVNIISSKDGAVASVAATTVSSGTNTPEIKPLIVLNGDIVPTSMSPATLVPSPSFISSPCFSESLSLSLGTSSNADLKMRYVSPKAASYSLSGVSCHHSKAPLNDSKNLLGVSSSFSSTPSTSSSLPDTATSQTGGPHQKGSEEQSSIGLFQEILKRQEEQAYLDRVVRRRVEAREKRRERREMRMMESLGRIATALELLSSKQDTVIALLQRLADRK
ncbi:uncharacterized protein LOC117528504 [Thalassophryne amazonica]|uniref:uncharacterized protein LOC117528504 n=1 Tax=Thalassophryne amazonica TaxID=390379 RepID=UPI001471EEF5|nr:uncharacterized protein LOC117528504 [Thalassophryne amazonica]